MKASATEIICCRELDPLGRQGPCIAMAIPVDPVLIVVRPHRVVCDVHNRPIVVVKGTRLASAVRP